MFQTFPFATEFSILGFPTPKPPVCKAPLGMQDNKIPDSSITASTTWNAHYTPPSSGRLEQQQAGKYGCWAASTSNTMQWFQVDFGTWTKVTMVATQGRQDAAWWTKSYTLAYSYDGVFWKDYKEEDYVKVYPFFHMLLECRKHRVDTFRRLGNAAVQDEQLRLYNAI